MRNSTEHKPVFHGGNLAAAVEEFGGNPGDWLDLSTGINPNSYQVGNLADTSWQRLPGGLEKAQLLNAARRFYGLSATADNNQIIAGNGTQTFIQLLPRIFASNRRVVILGPTYGEYERCWRDCDHQVGVVEDIDRIGEVDIAVVVNPNNPDGKTYTVSQLNALADQLAKCDGVLIVDEAFGDLDPSCSMVLCNRNNVIILKSFGKFFGLAGVRLGFAIGNLEIIRKLEVQLGPWSVNGLALEIGKKALSDESWINANRKWIASANERMLAIFSRNNIEVCGNGGLFILVIHTNAARLGKRLAQCHILVRQFDERPNLIRFGLCANNVEELRLANAIEWALGACPN